MPDNPEGAGKPLCGCTELLIFGFLLAVIGVDKAVDCAGKTIGVDVAAQLSVMSYGYATGLLADNDDDSIRYLFRTI